MKKLVGVLITPNQKRTQPRVHTMEYETYEDFYPLLECETFDIAERKFKDEYLDIYCDDEGLFKEGNKAAIGIVDNGVMNGQIVGTAFIVNHNKKGETISLTEEQIKKVMDCRVVFQSKTTGDRHYGVLAEW